MYYKAKLYRSKANPKRVYNHDDAVAQIRFEEMESLKPLLGTPMFDAYVDECLPKYFDEFEGKVRYIHFTVSAGHGRRVRLYGLQRNRQGLGRSR